MNALLLLTRAGILAVAGCSALALAADVPSGWKLIKDKKQVCQAAVPADWTTDKILTSMATSPDKKSSVVVHGLRAGASYSDTVTMAKQMFKPVKVFEDSASRTFYSSERKGKPGSSYYVAIGGAQVCNAQIDFEGSDDTAKKIANSLSAAK